MSIDNSQKLYGVTFFISSTARSYFCYAGHYASSNGYILALSLHSSTMKPDTKTLLLSGS